MSSSASKKTSFGFNNPEKYSLKSFVLIVEKFCHLFPLSICQYFFTLSDFAFNKSFVALILYSLRHLRAIVLKFFRAATSCSLFSGMGLILYLSPWIRNEFRALIYSSFAHRGISLLLCLSILLPVLMSAPNRGSATSNSVLTKVSRRWLTFSTFWAKESAFSAKALNVSMTVASPKLVIYSAFLSLCHTSLC